MISSHSLPSDWRTVCLSDIAEVRLSGVDKNTCNGEEPVLLCNYLDVYKHNYINHGMRFMRATARPDEISRLLLKPDDVIITKDSETWGDIAVPAYVKDVCDRLVCGYHLALITTDKSFMSGRFLFCCLQSKAWRTQFEQLAVGVTRYGISKDTISNALFPLPPLTEQRKIAEILGSVDDNIEETHRLIAKLQDLKRATTQELLTKGIGHTKFKDSPVGRIPEEWDAVRLNTLTTRITSGSRGWASYYAEDGALFLRISNLTREHIDLRFDSVVRVRPPEGSEGMRTRVSAGDVLISITADLGITGVIPDELNEAYVNQHIALIRLSGSKANPRWVAYVLAEDVGQRQFTRLNDSGAKAGLNLPTIGNVMLPLPSITEQNAIVSALDAIAHRISVKHKYLMSLQDLKKALMQDLLTGKVRVTV